MLNESILSLIVFLPLAGAGLLAILPAKGKLIQGAALLVTLATFLLTLHLPAHYDYAASGFQYESNHSWIASPNIRYHLGVDGLSMWLVVLTGFLAPFGVLISWKAITHRTKEFYVLFLLQQTAMLGVFVSLDLFLYYAFWEMTLVPMTLLIGIFGRTANRARAALKFFLYAFIPSALLLVGIVWVYAKTGTFDFPALHQLAITQGISPNAPALFLASLAFLFAFAVKVPVFPLHGWLGDAVSEAPTAAVMVLAGKLGIYSILRFSLGIFPAQSHKVAPVMIALAVIGILYGSLIALVQRDLKRLVAFATVAQLSFITLGIFGFSVIGIDGSIFQLLSESVSAGALFMLLGLLYERYGTYALDQYGGLASKLPWVATMFVITALALIGLPILNGFVGEFLILSGTFKAHAGWTSVATLGVILSAAFMLRMLLKVFYGADGPKTASVAAPDLSAREQISLWPFLALMLVMGVASSIWMRAIDPAAVRMTWLYHPDPGTTYGTLTVQKILQGGTR